MKNITVNLLIWDILLKDKIKYLIVWLLKENKTNKIYLKNLNNWIVKEHIMDETFLIAKYSFVNHLKQETDFYDKNWMLLRTTFSFQDCEENVDYSSWINTITVDSWTVNEISYSINEFSKDCKIITIIPKRTKEELLIEIKKLEQLQIATKDKQILETLIKVLNIWKEKLNFKEKIKELQNEILEIENNPYKFFIKK